MIERLLSPAITPAETLLSYPVPNSSDLVVVETIPTKAFSYKPLPIGTPHPDNATIGLDLRLAWQGQASGQKDTMKRLYTTGRIAENAYNYALKYLEESNSCPIYIRSYLVRRDLYAPLAKGSPLTGLIGVAITNPGSGYTHATGVINTGASVQFVVNSAGQIISGNVTSEGTNVAADGPITITGDGTGATATAIIQPAGAVLVKEDVEKLTEEIAELFRGWHEAMLGGLYLRVTRVYQTLPGPILTSYLWDKEARIIYSRTEQEIAAPNAAPPQTTGVLVEVDKIDSVRSKKIVTDKTSVAAISYATAIQSVRTKPYKFPGWYDLWAYANIAFRRYNEPKSQIVPHYVRTWWVDSMTMPVIDGTAIPYNAIITDTLTLIETSPITSTLRERTYGDILHDTGYFTNNGFVKATTPSFAEYTGLGALTQLTGSNFYYAAGSHDVVGTGSLFTSEVTVGSLWNDIAAVTVITDDTHLTLDQIPVPVGLPNENVATAFIRSYNASTAWVGNLKAVNVDITPDEIPNRWRIDVESVVMR